MLNLFNDTYRTRGSVVSAPNISWFKKRITENVSRLFEYYSSTPRAVFGNNLLAQILKISGAGSDNDAFGINDLAWVRNRFIVNGLKLTSDESTGTLLNLSIYGSTNSLNLAHPNYISPLEAVRSWGHLRPVKCIWLNEGYVSSDAPTLTTNADASDFTGISIDIPQLALMYKGWLTSRYKREATGQFTAKLGEEHFVAMYALPSILESQADITCTSALMSLYYGKYDDRRKVDAPIYLPSYSSDYRKIADMILNRLDGSKMQYQHVLQHIPAIFHESAARALVLPDTANSIQVEWARFISRLPVIEFLLDVGGSSGRRANQGLIGVLQKETRAMRGRGMPLNVMSKTQADYVENMISRIDRL